MADHPFDNPYVEDRPTDNFWRRQTTTTVRSLNDALLAMREQLADPETLRLQLQREAANRQWARWSALETDV